MTNSAWLRRPKAVLPLLLGFGLSACSAEMAGDERREIGDWGDESQYPELGGAYATLTSLVGTCTFNSTSGVMAIDANNTAQTIVIGRRPVDSAILINGATCGTPFATSATLKRLNLVDGMGGDQVVVIDYIGGIFGAGTSAARGVNIDLGAGTDSLRIRGTSAIDTFTFGGNGISINSDTARDIDVQNVEDFSVSLAGGNDVFSATGGFGTTGVFTAPVTVYGGLGNDRITGGSGSDFLYGGEGDDTIFGHAGTNEIYGEAGNDTILQGLAADSNVGTDIIDCGAGTGDMVTYVGRVAAVTVTIGSNADDGDGVENDDVGATCEGVTGGNGNDSLTGDAGNNVLNGGPGDDTLTGGDGNDTLNGGDGNDTFDEEAASNGSDIFNGGAGIDTVDYGARTVGIVVTMDGLAADDGEPSEGDNVRADIENLIGGDGNDVITGNALNNVLTGGDGNDTLTGGLGNDTFMEGSASNGNDTFHGGAGIDTVDYSGRSNDLTVTMDGVAANDGESGETDDVKADVENLVGGDGNDTITGNALDNFLRGGAGTDEIRGGAGNDVIFGGADNDDLYGDDGDDTLDGGAGDDDLTCGAGDDIAYNHGGGTRAADCEL